ncbi:RNA polymerase sigma factor [Chachezhania antarctica]|uniref:RNA polymerase sigma factor n=1 Tax=Chachezhania antarctica TaxID=2340860 RepID=UPI000EB22639|nr:RNA polymerase sigma factor [Chachezhania antarctica]|tara:strand:+ start:765 stop:1397 length:633 start_codon:yes stop_codon:yes gene_type:complete
MNDSPNIATARAVRDSSRADPVPSDDVLLAQFARGDDRAAKELAARHLPRVLSVAVRVLGDRAEAEDVAQEALLRLWRIAPDWEPDRAKVSTWLYRVAMNLCIDRKRRARGGTVDIDAVPEPMDPAPGAPEAMQAKARQAALDAALQALPDRQRQAVVLRHIEGLANPQIAEIMGLGVEAVESLTARGKRGLKAALAGRRGELGFDDDQA